MTSRVAPLVLLLALSAMLRPAAAAPEVDREGRVSFRLAAPAAQAVEVLCDNVGKLGLTRDQAGTWSATTEPLPPDLYGYTFLVDGVRMLDPGNSSESPVSLVLVPDRKEPRPWERADVPRGVVHRHSYRSAIAEQEREFLVYTPAGYEPREETRYPVLYLLHGAGGGPTDWTSLGRAQVVLDNLIAARRAVPMIVVMPSTYGRESTRRPPPASAAEWVSNAEPWQRDAEEFHAVLRREIMPAVERYYRIKEGATQRAIAGLSLGGAHALRVGLADEPGFGTVGAFSPGGPFRAWAVDFDRGFPSPHFPGLVWLACGRDDGLFRLNQEFGRWLERKGARHAWTETAGGHNWTVWRRNLTDLAPLLFRPALIDSSKGASAGSLTRPAVPEKAEP